MDPEGFDPYADTVGPGIYGGIVKLDGEGNVVIGKQYQEHNPRPGPVYAGGGYSEMSRAIHSGPEAVAALAAEKPELVGEVSTGGARPLHVCGMSRRGQLSTQALIEAGADINVLDTYGYTALHRMASNNLAVGAEALLRAGADMDFKTGPPYDGDSALDIAKQSRSYDVIFLFQRWAEGRDAPATGAGSPGSGSG